MRPMATRISDMHMSDEEVRDLKQTFFARGLMVGIAVMVVMIWIVVGPM